MDFSKRAFDHSYHIDPIVRSLLDTDFYKLLMLQFIWKKHPQVSVTFGVKNRTKTIHLTDVIDESVLREHLNYVRHLRFTESEIVWLRGQTFYGIRGLFEEGFLDYLRTFQLSDYELSVEKDEHDQKTGQFRLNFSGNWLQSSLWEIYALEIINELRYRSIMRTMNRSQLDIMYARAKVKLYDKLMILNTLDDLNISDFGTRRRHSFLWQEHCVTTAKEVLGTKFSGTSNAYLAMKYNLEAKGTNAHELPMVLTALAKTDKDKKQAQYDVLKEWQNVYRGGLLVMLPDTYGTTQFLKGLSPVLAETWKGARPDSKNPFVAGDELIQFWEHMVPGHVQDKLIIFSDGLDVKLPQYAQQGCDIPEIYSYFHNRVQMGFGFGTNFTNDFIGCHPEVSDKMSPISLVCKVQEVNHKSAVKLSDNYVKATGEIQEIEHYRHIFGSEGMDNIPVIV